MSGECDKCEDKALKLECINFYKMTFKIHETIKNSDPEMSVYALEALIRVFTSLAITNNFELEYTKNHVPRALEYYYSKLKC